MSKTHLISILIFGVAINNCAFAQNFNKSFSNSSIYTFNPYSSFKTAKITPLIDYKLKTNVFDSYEHSENIKEQLKKFNLVVANTDRIRSGLIPMQFNTLDKWFFDDYYRDYLQSHLKRLLQQPPDIWFLNHRSH
jgi:hypothetical protein